MTRKTGRILFIFFVLIFLLVGVAAVFYSLGYRINFDNFKIQKTGGIYIKTHPRGVTIKISGKIYPDASNLLQSGTLISNLTPKNYKVEIDKDGYYPYYKNLAVQPSMVAEILSVNLIPQKITPLQLASARGNTIIDSANNDNSFIIQNEKTGTYYLYDLSDQTKIVNLTSLYNSLRKSSKIKKITFVPFKPENFVVEDSSGIKIMDSSALTLTTLTKTPVAWLLQNSNVYFIASKSISATSSQLILSSYNLVFQNKSDIASLPQNFSNSEISAFKISGGNDKIAILDKTNTLFLFDTSKNTYIKLADNVKDFDFSPSSGQLAYLTSDNAINILFLKDFNGEITKKESDVVKFSLPPRENIQNITWYNDSMHLLVKYADSIKFMEINDLKPLNIAPLAGAINQLYYNPRTNNLFFIANEGLQKIDFGSF